MDRNELKNLSGRVTRQYACMLQEMSLHQTDGPVVPRRGPDELLYLRITELSRRWVTEAQPVWKLMEELFIGLYAMAAPVSLVFSSDGNAVSVYIGASQRHIESLPAMLRGVFPRIRWSETDSGIQLFSYAQAAGRQLPCGGFLKGDPTGSENFLAPFQIDAVIQDIAGRPWTLALFAQPVKKASTLTRQQHWLHYATLCSTLTQITYSSTDNAENTTYRQSYYEGELYVKKVDSFCQRALEALSLGEWCLSFNFSAASEQDVRLLGGLLTAAFYGEESEPEPVHAIFRTGPGNAPLVDGEEFRHTAFMGQDIPFPRYASYVSSRALAVFAAFPTADTSGIAVTDDVSFDVHQRSGGDLEIGYILDAGRITPNPYSIDVGQFNRHCLVVGLTGSGKTNTVKSLICGMTRQSRRPFLVIEPAKKEYWELYKLGYDDLQIYSVGSGEAGSHPLCLNPFEPAVYIDENGRRRTVPLQTHIDFVYAAFKASFIMYTPMPYVLERSIYEIYQDCGWDIHEGVNTRGREIYPTIEDLYFKIPQVVIDMGYDQKMRRDLTGSLQARINSLRLGAKGDTLNVRRSFPMDALFQSNAVIELEDIGDDDVKAFIISLLLVNLLEYRRQQEDCQLEVRHLTLIEEAHRLLKNVQSGSGENADPRGAAVEFFCNLLAELRSKGQGFIVADQIPSKLAPDLVKNTNLKIVHRTVDAGERALIGGAMHMTEEQIDSLAALHQGIAAVYAEGDNRPKLVRPKYAGDFTVAGREKMTRAQVLAATGENCISTGGRAEYACLTNARPEVCRRCDPHCDRQYADILSRLRDQRYFAPWADRIDPNVLNTCRADKIDEAIRAFLASQLPDGEDSARYCMLNCLLERWKLKKDLESRLIDVYMSNL